MLEKIEELRSLLKPISTDSVALRVAGTVGAISGKPPFEILTSPIKQCYYLLGLLMSTPKPHVERDIEEEDWKKCVDLLQSIYNFYGRMFFPEDGEFKTKSEEWKHNREVVMPVFLHHHNTTRTFSSVEQKIDSITGIFVAHDSILSDRFSISASIALEIAKWIFEEAQRKLDALMDAGVTIKRGHSLFVERTEGRIQNASVVMKDIQSDPAFQLALEVFHQSDAPWKVHLEEMRAKFGHSAANAFWRHFVSKRGEALEYTYPTELNPAEVKPLLEVSDGVAMCPIHNFIYDALIEQMTQNLTHEKQSESAQSFFKHRDKFLELRTEKIMRELFGDSASLFVNVFETSKARFEHDLIVLWNSALFIIEAKASPPAEPFRDPDKAYIRIKRHFKSDKGIQEAYNQSNRLRCRVLKGEDVSLFNADGKRIATIKAQDVEKVYCLCLTADNFGSLGTDLSVLLEKEDHAEYPWAVNIIDLETFTEALKYRSWGPEKFCEYLDARQHLHGRVLSTDELEIAGVFIKHGTLEPLSNITGDKIFLSPDMSNVFDDIYSEQHGGPKVDFLTDKSLIVTDVNAAIESVIKERDNKELAAALFEQYASQNRNIPFLNNKRKIRHFDPCPCGSGKKYKKCCSR